MSDEMDNKMKIRQFDATDFIEGELRHGAVSAIEIGGSYYIIENECRPQLIFQSRQINFTDQVEIQRCESSSSASGEAHLTIYVAGAQNPRKIAFMVDDGTTEHPQGNVTSQQVVENISSGNSSCVPSPKSEKVLLSDLRDDYNFVQCLEQKFESTSIGNVQDFIFTFDLSYEDHRKIFTCTRASKNFIKNLSKTKPQMLLRDLKDIIEKKRKGVKPNMAIFTKIDGDIKSGAVSFTLDATLEKLSNDPKIWLYILETIGGNLVPEKGTLLPSWKNIASACGYDASEIAAFESLNTRLEGPESPMQKFLSIICTREPLFPISDFVKKLRQFLREDVAQLVEQWQEERAGVSGN